jgi:hypothetical protein
VTVQVTGDLHSVLPLDAALEEDLCRRTLRELGLGRSHGGRELGPASTSRIPVSHPGARLHHERKADARAARSAASTSTTSLPLHPPPQRRSFRRGVWRKSCPPPHDVGWVRRHPRPLDTLDEFRVSTKPHPGHGIGASAKDRSDVAIEMRSRRCRDAAAGHVGRTHERRVAVDV